MRGGFLLGSSESRAEGNIYADRSSLVLDWLLRVGVGRGQFAIRDVVRERKVSIGLVHRVFEVLVQHGLLQTEGLRTAKRFSIDRPSDLLNSWLERYSLVYQCRRWTYRTGLSDRGELLEVLSHSNLKSETALTLHAAAEAYGCKNTNLDTLELYVFEPSIRSELEQALLLEPQEKGYEVLLVRPYYRALLKTEGEFREEIKVASPLLTFLDLYHFPLRGREQAEFMAQRLPELKRIYHP